MKALARLSHKKAHDDFYIALHKHADLLLEDCKSSFKNEHDVAELQHCYDEIKLAEK